MNKNKIDFRLLPDVTVMDNNRKQDVIVFSSRFSETKRFLKQCGIKFLPYRFAGCFYLTADDDDLNILSEQAYVQFVYSNPRVMAELHEKDVMHLSRLTENKFFGQNQTICFIDTGIYPHFDFVFPHSRIVKFIDLVNKESTPYDDNGHGTFVTGIACGGGIVCPELKGYAPLSNIISIKALGEKGESNSNVILDAMQWVYENHKAYNIGIVCLSLGADVINDSDPLSNGAEALWKRGIVVVAAAGNSGPEKATIKSPGNNPNILTVGALDTSNMSVADFSSRGPTIYGHKPDLIAPAVNLTACTNSLTPYTEMSGTSVATPIVAGICSIIKSRWPNMTNTEIKEYLISHCTKITGDIDTEGAGYINF